MEETRLGLLRVVTAMVVTVSSLCLSQEYRDARGVLLDTSFTLESAAGKVLRQYPFAEPVQLSLPPAVSAMYDIVYARWGSRALVLDVFQPANVERNAFPCILFVHGGGWRSGDKSMEWTQAIAMAQRGCVTVTVEYRRSLEAMYPAAVYDVKAALRWIRAHAREYRIDTTRIAIAGTSAGGQLAALVGVTGGDARFEGSGSHPDRSSVVQAIVNIDGVSDFTRSEKIHADTIPGRPTVEAQWLGGSYPEAAERWREASPLSHVSDRTPPMLFVNSSIPRYRVGREEMMQALAARGIRCDSLTIPNTPHPFWLFRPWFEITVDRMTDFLEQVWR